MAGSILWMLGVFEEEWHLILCYDVLSGYLHSAAICTSAMRLLQVNYIPKAFLALSTSL